MDSTKPERSERPWWLIAAAALAAIWVVGAYMPATSNAWVALNLLAPAGRPHMATFPFAYPAVGVDGHTLCSLLGLMVVTSTAARWVTYLERYTPPLPVDATPTANSLPPAAR